MSVDVRLGYVDFTENNVRINYFGNDDYVDTNRAFVTRGAWLETGAQYGVFDWLALAGVARFGSEERGPPTPDDETGPGVDPQLGDSRVGGSVAPIARFFPGYVALDAGFTYSVQSFRPRGKASQGYDWWPTFRISSTWEGPQFAFGTGEGFIHANEPTFFEMLTGYRERKFAMLIGISRGISTRLDALLGEFQDRSGLYLTFDLSFKPWGSGIEQGDRGQSRFIFDAGLSWRTDAIAPM